MSDGMIFKAGMKACAMIAVSGMFATAVAMAAETGAGQPVGPVRKLERPPLGPQSNPALRSRMPTPPAMGMGDGEMNDMLAAKLGLSEEQKAKAREIRTTQRSEMEKTWKGMGDLHRKLQDAIDAGDEAAAQAAGLEIGKATGAVAVLRIKAKKETDAILTPEQKAKSEELRKAQKARMEQMREQMNTRMKERMNSKSGTPTVPGAPVVPGVPGVPPPPAPAPAAVPAPAPTK